MNSSPTTNEPPSVAKIVKLAGAEIQISKGKAVGTFKAIPIELWSAIIGFHRQIAINHDAESVSYHRWSEKEQCYHSLIPYQVSSGCGLSVTTKWDDPRNIALLDAYGAKYGEEFLPACTIHTHVDISAFESGTDANDEAEAPGWHITLGKLISHPEYHLHFRMRMPKLKSINELIRTDCAYILQWKHLFDGEELEKQIQTIPGTTDWHDKLNRVQIV